MARLAVTPIERFWPKVNKTSTCWEWTAGKFPDGYGVFRIKKNERAHRAAWMLLVGEIPEGMDVCYKCDNPGCVNPDHLFLGTHTDNMRDKTVKFRHKHGIDHHSAKLTEEKVRWMREQHQVGRSMRSISEELGLNCKTARLAIQGVTWAHMR